MYERIKKKKVGRKKEVAKKEKKTRTLLIRKFIEC